MEIGEMTEWVMRDVKAWLLSSEAIWAIFGVFTKMSLGVCKINAVLNLKKEHIQYRQKAQETTYDELSEACKGLLHRVGSEDLTLHRSFFSQETMY